MKFDRRALLLVVLALVACSAIVFRHLRAGPDEDDDGPGVRFRPQIDKALFALDTTEPVFADHQMLVSQLCTQSQLETEPFRRWVGELKETPRYHSKQWEYAYILQALAERGMLASGKRGVGFGVGQEPVPSVLAKYGVEVLATDLEIDEARKLGWAESNQHLSSIEILNKRGIVSDAELNRLVKVMNVDMNAIPSEVVEFDFAWSTCALGHLGSLEKGLSFIENSLRTIKPGGVVVHTTELNLSSNTTTYETPGTVVYRRRDIEALAAKLRAEGHEIALNFSYGRGELDSHVDDPPYSADKHLKLRLGGYVVTSLGLIIRKNPAPSAR